MSSFKKLLLPFSWLYALGVYFHQSIYRWGILRRHEFSLPIIAVGNLSTGGTGKTPHVEYLARLLGPFFKVAVLSRGYRRKSRGFRFVQRHDNAEIAGDEPLIFKRKYPELIVAVSEDRSFAVPKIMGSHPDVKTILLDDAFQHLPIKASQYLLLTTFENPFFEDALLPSGNLRDFKSSYSKADIIIVTKCPIDLTTKQRDQFIQRLKPEKHQSVYFTCYKYGNPYSFNSGSQRILLEKDADTVVLTGIANTEYLLDYLKSTVRKIRLLEHGDHHFFSKGDMGELSQAYSSLESSKKVILTTEKDALRLEEHRHFIQSDQLPVFILPVEVHFLFNAQEQFDDQIKQLLLEFKI